MPAPHAPVVSPALSLAQLGAASPGDAFDPTQVCTQGECPPEIGTFASEHSQAATTPLGKVVALAAYLLKNGSYSNGGGRPGLVTAGHSEGRLDNFLASKQIVGDDEQYAATMALLANVVGVPARVSLDGDGREGRRDQGLGCARRRRARHGRVRLGDAAGRPFTGNKKPTVQRQQIAPPQLPVKVVPPRQNEAAPVAAVNQSSAVARGSAKPSAGNGFTIPPIVITVATDAGVPFLAVAGLAAALAAAKAMRRRRRRSFGPPATRVAGAWRELIDLSRDLGIVAASPDAAVKPGIPRAPERPAAAAVGAPTRREFAAYAESRGLPSARAVADAADAATLGRRTRTARRRPGCGSLSRRRGAARRRRCPGGGARGSWSTRGACGRPARRSTAPSSGCGARSAVPAAGVARVAVAAATARAVSGAAG